MYDVEYAIVATRWVLAATNLGWCSKRGLLEDEWAEIRWGNVIDEPPPKKVGPQRFSKIAGGELPLLMRGRGVSTTAMIGKKQYLVAALIPSEAGTVWPETPVIKAVAEKAAEMQRKRSAKSNPSLDPALQKIRVVRVRRASRQGSGWYVYLCVPRVPDSPKSKQKKNPVLRSRFKNLEF